MPDSREGWGQAIEKMEVMAFEGRHRDTVLILDFSEVRPEGSPIKGMQDRPASGPGPLIAAIGNVAKLRDAGMKPWRSALYADHYLAECVLVGGARRAARMSTKCWRDPDAVEFVNVKRPIEFHGKTGPEIQKLRAGRHFDSFLWSSNNSITVDKEFWSLVEADWHDVMHNWSAKRRALAVHARAVYDAVMEAAYFDGTGEPAFINVDKLTHSDEGTEVLFDGEFAGSARYQVGKNTKRLMKALSKAWKGSKYKVITNPCGEIVLIMLGGYCVIADVVPFHAGSTVRTPAIKTLADAEQANAAWDADAEEAYRVAVRALIRTNLMDSLYAKEVARTNRIGVGMTGIHEYAFARFGYGWKDLVNEDASLPFWLMLSRFKRAVQDEAVKYATELGVAVPHTDTTMKPAGTTSKLFGLTEGAHLPSMREFLRWVQYRTGASQIEDYRAQGYPVRDLKVYQGTTIVGFPTVPGICELGMGDKLVTAAEATPEEQFEWLRLLEKYWIVGVEEDGFTPLRDTGNQVSYTLKYDPKVTSYERFRATLLAHQPNVRCCSVMPQEDVTSYEYQPEEPVTKAQYEQICAAIKGEAAAGDVGREHVECEGGACPIDFGTNSASA